MTKLPKLLWEWLPNYVMCVQADRGTSSSLNPVCRGGGLTRRSGRPLSLGPDKPSRRVPQIARGEHYIESVVWRWVDVAERPL